MLIDAKLSTIIDQNIANSINENHCDTIGKIELTYTVKHYTLNFISIVKLTYVECQSLPSFISYEDCLNYLYFNKELYSVEVEYTAQLESEIISDIQKKIEPDCLRNIEVNKNLDLYFEKGKPLITNPLLSKFCSAVVEIAFKRENFKITLIDSKK